MTTSPDVDSRPSDLIAVDLGGRSVQIECRFLAPERTAAPLIVFLHEGLGSLALWRDFPRQLCDAGGFRGLVFSRPGYGRSTPRRADESWGPRFLHGQAIELLPPLFRALGLDETQDPPWLFGHSDGGSIALIHAATFPGVAAGLIVLAPHIHVEELTIRNIEDAREKFIATDLRAKLGRYHDDVDSAFWGWNDIWLDPAFRAFSLHELLPSIICPVLAIQGEDDEYGTMAQIDGIKASLPQTELLKLAHCGHSAHRDRSDAVIAATVEFVTRHCRGARLSA